jgi:hypothetical protein
MRPVPEQLDLALVKRLRQVVGGAEPATESELRALAEEADGWVRATEAQLHASEGRLTELNADPASPLTGIAAEVRRVDALSRELAELPRSRPSGFRVGCRPAPAGQLLRSSGRLDISV